MVRDASRRRPHGGLLLLARGAVMLLAPGGLTGSGPLAWCQTGVTPPSASAEAMPAYEVVSVKPPGPNGFAMPLRVYIQTAFGIPGNSLGWVIGPDWINSERNVIQGKPPDAIRDAMQTMTSAERTREIHLMQQGVLADRFKLKGHFETKEMPVYELVPAKGGAKLKENQDVSQGQAAVGRSSFRGKAVPIAQMLGLLESVPEIGGRVIIDKTGLLGTYDFSLKWTPMEATAPSSGSTGTATTPSAEGASLFTAIEEQLGLRLVPARGPGQVLIIDHIERPSEN